MIPARSRRLRPLTLSLVPALFLIAVSVLAVVPPGAGSGAGGTTGTLLRTESMRREPYTDARRVIDLRTGARVTVLERRGGWYHATSGRHAGWIRMLSVRLASTGASRTASGVETGRSGSGGIVSTTGIRALDAGELRAAAFSETEAARLSALAVTAGDARLHASRSGLLARPLPYLPTPRATRGPRR